MLTVSNPFPSFRSSVHRPVFPPHQKTVLTRSSGSNRHSSYLMYWLYLHDDPSFVFETLLHYGSTVNDIHNPSLSLTLMLPSDRSHFYLVSCSGHAWRNMESCLSVFSCCPHPSASPASIWNPSPTQSSSASTLVSATVISHLTLQQPPGWPPASGYHRAAQGIPYKHIRWNSPLAQCPRLSVIILRLQITCFLPINPP